MRSELTRSVWLVAVALFGALIVAYFRSMSFGSSAPALVFELGFALLWAVPLATPVLLRVKPREAALRGASVLLASVLLGESWCLAEELSVRRELGPCDAASVEVVRDRWWPFDAHYVFCTPGQGWGGGD